jgi:Domain of unknown function (DUF2017)
MARRRIKRRRGGGYALRLPQPERELLIALPEQLAAILESDDPSLTRLFPPGYGDDLDASAEYDRLVRDELVDGKRDALATMTRTATADQLSEEELLQWLTATNDLRLVLGTRLGVTEDHQGFMPSPNDPWAPEWVAYNYLSWLQEEIVAALSDAL